MYFNSPEQDLLIPASDINTTGTVPLILTPEEKPKLQILENTSEDFTKAHRLFWESLTEEKLNDESIKFKSFLELLDHSSLPSDFKGSGVVYSSNSASTTITSIKFLRHYGCTLPIEVWHNNELSYERDDLSTKPFGSHVNDVKCRST
jgi:Mannosyltransferase putative